MGSIWYSQCQSSSEVSESSIPRVHPTPGSSARRSRRRQGWYCLRGVGQGFDLAEGKVALWSTWPLAAEVSTCHPGPSHGGPPLHRSKFGRAPPAPWWADQLAENQTKTPAPVLGKRRKDPPKASIPQLKFLGCSKLNWKHGSRLLNIPPSLSGKNWLKY